MHKWILLVLQLSCVVVFASYDGCDECCLPLWFFVFLVFCLVYFFISSNVTKNFIFFTLTFLSEFHMDTKHGNAKVGDI